MDSATYPPRSAEHRSAEAQEIARLKRENERLRHTLSTYRRTGVDDLNKTLIQHEGTDIQLGESKEWSENLGLYGACEELLYYVGKEDAEFFRLVAEKLATWEPGL